MGGTISLFSDRTRQAAEPIAAGDRASDAEPDLAMPYTQWIWARMDTDLGADPSVLFIGGGGYHAAYTAFCPRGPGAQAVAVEIDPLITEVVRRHLPQAGAMIGRAGYDAAADAQPDTARPGQLGIVHADGRVYLNETTRRYDAAVMDAFFLGLGPRSSGDARNLRAAARHS